MEQDNFRVDNVTTIQAERAFWDKIIILHGLYQPTKTIRSIATYA